MTDRYAVIGNPIAHSKSPLIHKLFGQQTGQDISYEAVLAPLDGFAATVERLRNEGYKGCNVTVPFKQSAYQLANRKQHLSFDVVHAHAANTLEFKSDGVHLHNTDGIGLIHDIQDNLGVYLRDKRVLLIGAGGAARGVISPLRLTGASITITNRTVDKAHDLAKRFVVSSCSYEELAGKSFDIVINATSSGLSDEMPPLPNGIFAPHALAYDMMYGKKTPFMKFAREQGAAIVSDGLGMLVEQAAESFFLWRGVRPDTRPVIEQLRKQQ
ncbi:MAG: shikimate dehydrogenase [Nitrosomonadales bacterium]|nr:shikimate dehydrogenase [Nitrosomonadales bacterium]